MTNTILKFNQIELSNYFSDGNTQLIKDFTASVYSIPEKYFLEKYYDNVMVEDDERLDKLCWKYYENIDLWDLILIFNKMSSPLELPKNYNFVIERGQIRYNEWYETYGYGKPEWFLLQKRKYFEQVSAVENEKYRTIKLIKREYMIQFRREIYDHLRTMS